jgi:hypothetical protein
VVSSVQGIYTFGNFMKELKHCILSCTIMWCLHTCVFNLSLSSPLSHINSLFLHVYTLHFTVICCIVGKGKVHPRICHKGPEGELRCSSTLPLTSALDGGGSSAPRPDRFTPRKDPVLPLYRRLGGPQGWSEQMQKISSPLGVV